MHGPEWTVIIIMIKKLIGSNINVDSIHWFCPNCQVCSLQLEYNTTKSTTTLNTPSGLDSLASGMKSWLNYLPDLLPWEYRHTSFYSQMFWCFINEGKNPLPAKKKNKKKTRFIVVWNPTAIFLRCACITSFLCA